MPSRKPEFGQIEATMGCPSTPAATAVTLICETKIGFEYGAMLEARREWEVEEKGQARLLTAIDSEDGLDACEQWESELGAPVATSALSFEAYCLGVPLCILQPSADKYAMATT
ncbi:hypothetical protein EDD16DRAFT_1516823 [Pisolithus croceorrhizus]|nr:hypothetical protein EDD16DRAFT_1516823 [Pisolithus croceorrhizus]KAI6167690.1 hypothetical protein EDD17DRAFT_1892970 [Pisolithus thermaeus]